MGNSGSDDLVTDVADALTLNQEVEWERCAEPATPANRRVLDSPGAWLRQKPLASAGGVRVLDASTAQHVHNRIVPLVAAILEQVSRGSPPAPPDRSTARSGRSTAGRNAPGSVIVAA